MSELVEFLLARIAEDEKAAKAVPGGGGTWEEGDRCIWRVSEVASLDIVTDGRDGEGGCETPEIGVHVARHDPARVLRECEAKRGIIDAHPHQDTTAWDTGLWCHTCQWDTDCDMPMTNVEPDSGTYPCPTLRAVAAVYADHPDYRDEWA